MSVVTENYTIDLGDDSSLTLTKRIYDVQEPDKRQSHFTKTITVPSSKTNDLVFAGMFDVNFHLTSSDQFDPWFNPNKKAQCILHTDTAEQMSGYAQLTDIVLNRYTNKVEYKITLYGEIRDLFADLTNKKLSELDLSKYNHLYTKDSITDSWDYTVQVNGSPVTYFEGGNGYVYPMVDYGDNHIYLNQLTGTPITDYWKVTHFRPWIYAKTIVDAIFQESGFSYYSAFFNSSLFKKLIYQGDVNGLTKSDAEVEAGSIVAEMATDISYTNIGDNRTGLYAYANYPIIYQTETLDPANQYNNTTGVIDVAQRDVYNVKSTISFTITNNSSVTAIDSIVVLIEVIEDARGTPLYSYSKTLDLGAFGDSKNIASGASKLYAMQFSGLCEISDTESVKLCVRKVQYMSTANATTVNNQFTITLLDGSTFALIPQAATAVGATVDMSRLLNDDLSCKDFMMGIVKMFNLYIEPYWFRVGDVNSGNYNQYLIEPRDDYFTNDVIDWTGNLDIEKDFVIKPAALVDAKYFHFTYKDDNDYLNTTYKGQTGRIYGDYVQEIDNDFAKGTKKIEIPFSPCPVSDNQNSVFSRLMPVNYATTGGQRTDGKPKVLFYNSTVLTSDEWYFEGVKYSNYPLSGQLDDPFEPTCDLSFAQPLIIYHRGDSTGQLILTNGTLFNRYYYRQVTETTDKNSKMVECYMRLRPSDIHNLSFRPLYFIKDAYYRLYEVVDHNYSDTTLCRFLKINEATPISNATTSTRGGRGTITGTTEKTPTIYKIPDDKIDWSRGGGFYTGTGGPGELVIAAGTTSKGYTDGISGNNVLQAGLSKGEIIKDNTISLGFNYINIASGSTTITGFEGSPLFVYASTASGDINIYMPDPAVSDGNMYWINKIPAAFHVYIYDYTDLLFHTITAANETHQIQVTQSGLKLLTG